MTDPYEILGVSRNATDEEIKNAYREKARKYQQDNYEGSPLQDIAEKRMKELDDAYDKIMEERRTRGYNRRTSRTSSSGTYSSAQSGRNANTGYSTPTYAEIRDKVKRNRLDEAEVMLNSIPPASRIAEWYYLTGIIQQKKGWTHDAYQNYQRACQMDPSNSEYRKAFNNLHDQRNGGYRTNASQRQGSNSGCSFCNMCQGLICADCCCEAMGGDLIPCC